MIIILCAVIGYLFGCFNSSIVLTRLIEKDVRNYGSGNAGFTNTLRNFSLLTAVLVFVCDAIKAAAAIFISLLIAPDNDMALYASAIGVILGHNFPFLYRFKGGKGVLVSSVAIFFADWRIGIAVFVISVLIMFATRYVSLGSLTGAVIFPLLSFYFHSGDTSFIIFSLVVSLLGIYMHRSNIKRLIEGKENRFGKGKNNV